jgi:hypothetical protein
VGALEREEGGARECVRWSVRKRKRVERDRGSVRVLEMGVGLQDCEIDCRRDG